MSKNTLKDFNYEDLPCITFIWPIVPGSNLTPNVFPLNKEQSTPWTKTTPKFEINRESSSKCFLRMHCTFQSNKYNYTVKFELHFFDKISGSGFDEFTLRVSWSPIGQKYFFKLLKDGNNDQIFTGTSIVQNECLLGSGSAIDLWIKILYDNTSVKAKVPRSVLINNLKSLLEYEKHSDLTIIATDVRFKVHKGMVSCRSNVLAKMIETNMLEKENNEIKLQHWDPTVVKELILYIYTGTCNLSKIPHELFKLAHYLEMEHLAAKCKIYLNNNINIKNIIDVLELSEEEQYGLSDLKSAAKQFVKWNEKTLVTDTEFQEYLCTNMRLDNIVFALRIAYTYNINDIMKMAMEFVKLNYKKVLEREDCKLFFLSQANLMLKIFEFCCDSYTTTLDQVEKNDA